MVTITTRYDGGLRCSATHGPSASTLITDAPTDNMGKGEAFSPTDLVATALATCILTTMGIVAGRIGAHIDGATAEVTKTMAATPPRRIALLTVTIAMPAGIAPEYREKLEHAAHHCPVHLSLHPDTQQDIRILWPD
jgi:putative redox protein